MGNSVFLFYFKSSFLFATLPSTPLLFSVFFFVGFFCGLINIIVSQRNWEFFFGLKVTLGLQILWTIARFAPGVILVGWGKNNLISIIDSFSKVLRNLICWCHDALSQICCEDQTPIDPCS